MNENQRHISWLTIVLAVLAVASFIAISNPDGRYVTPMGIGGGTIEYKGSPPMMDTSVYNPYPYPDSGVPVTDTREFLKVNYNASMRTRDVQGLTRRVETTVRGYAGRIDQQSSSSQYGSVGFAVPKTKYDAFRVELEGLVGSRFLSVSISSQNLLSQKLSIEEQQKQADVAVSNYTKTRQNIVSVHASTVRSLQTRIDQAQSGTPEWTSLNQQLASENASYTTQLRNADANIKYAQDVQKAVRTQDQKLLDTVATVTGTVSIQWISLWDIAQLYLPGYWIPTIFAVLAFLSFLWDRRRTH